MPSVPTPSPSPNQEGSCLRLRGFHYLNRSLLETRDQQCQWGRRSRALGRHSGGPGDRACSELSQCRKGEERGGVSGEPSGGEASTKGGHSHLAVCKSAAAVINDQQEGGRGVPSGSRLSFLL